MVFHQSVLLHLRATATILVLLTLVSCSEKTASLPDSLRTDQVLDFQQLPQADAAALRSVNAGGTVTLVLPGEATAQLRVERRMSVMAGVVSLSGKVSASNMDATEGALSQGDFAISYDETMITGTLSVLGAVYEFASDRETGLQWILQVDPAKQDVLPGSDPLEIPRETPAAL